MARKAATPKKTAKKSSTARKTASAAKAEAPATKKKAAKTETKGVKTKRKSRTKKAAIVRLKAFWGVYSQTLKPVAIFEYSQRKQADKKASDLSTSQRSPHFVKLIKEVIE